MKVTQQDIDDKNHELLMRKDYEYALEQLGWGKYISVKEFVHITNQLQELGWEVSYDDMLQVYINTFIKKCKIKD